MLDTRKLSSVVHLSHLETPTHAVPNEFCYDHNYLNKLTLLINFTEGIIIVIIVQKNIHKASLKYVMCAWCA